MRVQTTIEIFDYWNRIRGAADAPLKSQVEPSAVPHLLQSLFILERREGGDIGFRLAGTRICDLFGRDLRGERFSSLWANSQLADIERTAMGVMSGRLEPIYSHLLEGPAESFRDGLTLHRLRADAGYGDEVLLTAPIKGGQDYVVRCILPSSPDKAASGDCQRDIKVGRDLSVLYRFSSSHLNDWEHIDAAIRTFVEARLMNRSATSP